MKCVFFIPPPNTHPAPSPPPHPPPRAQNIPIKSILMSKKDIDHKSVTYVRKLKCNNPKPDLVNINAHAKFGQISFISSRDIERKQNSDFNQGL